MAFARGKYAKAISDRSGMEFPYREMMKEWNGMLVHRSEHEEKHPQLEPPLPFPNAAKSVNKNALRDERLQSPQFARQPGFLANALCIEVQNLDPKQRNDKINIPKQLLKKVQRESDRRILIPRTPKVARWHFQHN